MSQLVCGSKDGMEEISSVNLRAPTGPAVGTQRHPMATRCFELALNGRRARSTRYAIGFRLNVPRTLFTRIDCDSILVSVYDDQPTSSACNTLRTRIHVGEFNGDTLKNAVVVAVIRFAIRSLINSIPYYITLIVTTVVALAI